MQIVSRHLSALAVEVLDMSPALVIEGARQVGKSTLARLFAADASVTSVTLDDDQVRAFATQDPVGLLYIDCRHGS